MSILQKTVEPETLQIPKGNFTGVIMAQVREQMTILWENKEGDRRQLTSIKLSIQQLKRQGSKTWDVAAGELLCIPQNPAQAPLLYVRSGLILSSPELIIPLFPRLP